MSKYRTDTFRNTLGGISLVLLLCGAAHAQRAGSAPKPSGRGELRVLTYNIHHGAGNETCPDQAKSGTATADCGLNLERIADVIRKTHADIVGLQEVDRFWLRSGGEDQPRALARLLAMSVCFGPNLQLASEPGGGSPREYGTAILSRFPLEDCRNVPLPRASEKNEQRGLLSAEVATPAGKIRMMVTHLSFVAADQPSQITELAKSVSESDLPTILVGDLNIRPQAQPLQPLLQHMRDVWVLAGTGDGLTSPARPDRPARNRIDYILVSPQIEASGIEVVKNATTRMASDHYPVLARI
ncbi:MAG: endonuclease/exonuclease/phosphatase family protein, partial [Bryobacterales bacterium]|nr:endonuclease/exonuclease/phosphatase family protein [Bryobacterales bacterium]